MKAQKKASYASYDFSLKSPSEQPGFEVFEDTRHKCWRFYGNDVEGRAALFSQPYATAESAQRGLQTTIRLLKKKRSRVLESSDGFQIVIQSGNHQELARSRNYSEKEPATKLLQYFVNVASAASPVIDSKPTPASQPEVSRVNEQPSDKPFRYAFRLFFYPSEKKEGYRGRIENINAPSACASFEGLDANAILGFLQTQLIQKTTPDKTVANQPEPEFDTLTAQITPGPSASSVVSRNQTGTTIDLMLQTELPLPAGSKIALESSVVFAQRIDSGEQTMFSNLPGTLQADGQIKLQAEIKTLATGTYYLNANVWLRQGTGKARHCIHGTGWLQLL